MPNPPMNRHAILLTTDLMSLSPFSFAAQTAGGSLEAAASLEQLNTKLAQRLPSVVLIDLTLSRLDLEQAVAAVRNASIPADGSAGPISIIAYGPHVHEGRLEAARQAGCDLVLTRGQAHRGLAELLRQTWGCSQ